MACNDKPVPVVVEAGPDPAAHANEVLKTIPAQDIAGFMSGNYHTVSNNPVMYADTDRGVFVLMGAKTRAELPIAKRKDATAAYEQLLLLHGYEPNGKKPDPVARPTIMIDGSPLVVVTMDELLPTMPPEIRKRFTDEQYDTLGHVDGRTGLRVVAAKYPALFAYSKSIVVLGRGAEQEFPIEKANDAFSAYEKLLP
jgi:hypothetical protein